jgi:hypothetical protein
MGPIESGSEQAFGIYFARQANTEIPTQKRAGMTGYAERKWVCVATSGSEQAVGAAAVEAHAFDGADADELCADVVVAAGGVGGGDEGGG